MTNIAEKTLAVRVDEGIYIKANKRRYELNLTLKDYLVKLILDDTKANKNINTIDETPEELISQIQHACEDLKLLIKK